METETKVENKIETDEGEAKTSKAGLPDQTKSDLGTQTQPTSLIEGMFAVGAHYGYSRSRRHPSFSPIIFGTKNGTDVIDLEKTSFYLGKALDFIKDSIANKKTILFVGTKPEIRKVVEETALSLDVPHMTNRWVGGLMTNFSEMKKRIKRLESLRDKKEKGELDVYTKKERIVIDHEIDGLVRNFGGIVSMIKPPDVMFVVDPRHEDTAIKEAASKGIKVVALAGSDCNISTIAYTIPANDSTLRSVSFFMEKVAEAYKDGLKNQKIEAEKKEAEKIEIQKKEDEKKELAKKELAKKEAAEKE